MSAVLAIGGQDNIRLGINRPREWATRSRRAAMNNMIEILEEHPDDVVEKELESAIWALNEDEQIDLVALAWLGRGDGDASEWDDLRHQAAEAHNNRTAAYLLGLPLLPDYLEEALDQFGESSAAAMEGKL
ncbi:DUF3775 domain-containing protein [Rhizobium sp. YTUHZ044]|uniref:DUF3775 domain-containing protein n=1 Tax=Rhizobium sp. YTUHZ044 TaxID=2962678 RepID=UPI003DA9D9EE